MERGCRKRNRAHLHEPKLNRGRSVAAGQEPMVKKGKALAAEINCIFSDDVLGYLLEASDINRPQGIFEFPWKNELCAVAEESEGSDLHDVFFSSLVDGCSAAIGFPGDRLSPPGHQPIALPGEADGFSPSDEATDGADCIWSCALHQPLSAVYRSL